MFMLRSVREKSRWFLTMRVIQETTHVLSAINRKLIRISDGILKQTARAESCPITGLLFISCAVVCFVVHSVILLHRQEGKDLREKKLFQDTPQERPLLAISATYNQPIPDVKPLIPPFSPCVCVSPEDTISPQLENKTVREQRFYCTIYKYRSERRETGRGRAPSMLFFLCVIHVHCWFRRGAASTPLTLSSRAYKWQCINR